jgi:zinc transport system permease protein
MIEILLLFREAFLGALVIGLGCSILGVFVVYRRVVFVAAALAQLSSAGVALAGFLAGSGIALAVGPGGSELALSLLATFVGVIFFSLEGGRRRVPGDALLGIAFVLAGAAAVLLAAQTAGADAQALLLRGNILGITGGEIRLLSAVIFIVLAVHFLFHKELVFVSYDREMAATLGFHTLRWSLLLYAMLGLVIAVSIQAAGVLLVFSFLVLPPVTGILLGNSLPAVMAWSSGSGLAAAALGFIVSVQLDLPTGPAIVAMSGVFLGMVWLVSRARFRI